MLVASSKRLVPQHINTIVLQGEDGMYYYLHRDVYDQLTILADVYRYGEVIDSLVRGITNYQSFDELPQLIKDFYDRVPWPLKIAAIYLDLVTDVEKLDDFIDQVGALSVMSMSINFRRVPQVDKSLRAALKFSLHIKEEYVPTWDRFFQENPELGKTVVLQKEVAQYAPPPMAAYPTEPPSVQTRPQIVEMPEVPSVHATHIPTQDGSVIVKDEDTGEEEEIQFTSDPAAFDFSSLGDMLADMAGSFGTAREAAEDKPSSSSNYDDDDDGDDDQPTIKSGFGLLEGV